MNTELMETLPASPKALKALAEANGWEEDKAEGQKRSERRAWAVAAVGCTLGVLGMAIGAFQSLRPLPAPVPIVVDRTTGESTVVPMLTADTVPKILAVDQNNATHYVYARESYFFSLLKRDYDQVSRMSTAEVFAPYAAKFSGDNAMQTKIGKTQEHVVTIISSRPSSTTEPGRRGEMIVTYDLLVTSTQGLSPVTTRHIATLGYEYRPQAMKKTVDRAENPLGFVVLSYRDETELITPAASPAQEANGAGTQ